jgi:hypothetical protein
MLVWTLVEMLFLDWLIEFEVIWIWCDLKWYNTSESEHLWSLHVLNLTDLLSLPLYNLCCTSFNSLFATPSGKDETFRMRMYVRIKDVIWWMNEWMNGDWRLILIQIQILRVDGWMDVCMYAPDRSARQSWKRNVNMYNYCDGVCTWVRVVWHWGVPFYVVLILYSECFWSPACLHNINT